MRSSASNPTNVTVHVPLAFVIRGGRKQIISESGQATDMGAVMTPRPAPQSVGNALLKALARAHRWQRMIEEREYASITELARAENINESYACRILRLTLLSPAIVTDILNGCCPFDLMLKKVTMRLPPRWDEQVETLQQISSP
jgi:hypothetical protein